MQLFITDFQNDGDKIIIKEKRVVSQLKNVLRAKFGYNFYVQDLVNSEEKKRFKVELLEFKGNSCITRMLTKSNKKLDIVNFGVLIPILNKSTKHELIVQKLVEIGIPNIMFYRADRSVVKEISQNKINRLSKISLEAAEQSMSWILPKIEYVEFVNEFVNDKKLIIFDESGESCSNLKLKKLDNIYAIIGPEGGFTSIDLNKINDSVIGTFNLGDSVLRSETAAIVGGRIMKNLVI